MKAAIEILINECSCEIQNEILARNIEKESFWRGKKLGLESCLALLKVKPKQEEYKNKICSREYPGCGYKPPVICCRHCIGFKNAKKPPNSV